MQTHPKLSLIAHLQDLPDPRINRGKDHDLIDILVIALCALLCGAESFNDMEDFGLAKYDWFKGFLKLANGIPSHDTFNRLFAALDPKAFLDCFLAWTAKRCGGLPTVKRLSSMWSALGPKRTAWCSVSSKWPISLTRSRLCPKSCGSWS